MKTTCGNCRYYRARPVELFTTCVREGVCLKTAKPCDTGWDARLAPCNNTCSISRPLEPTYWIPADNADNKLAAWAGSFDGHLVLTAAVRYAWDRGTDGSETTVKAIAKLIPYASAQTAAVIARDIKYWRDELTTWHEMSAAQRELHDACEERLDEVYEAQ